jgi:hypothetical protein
VFALVEGIIDAGLVTRAAWIERLGSALAEAKPTGEGAYAVWLDVLEAVLVDAGVADRALIARMRDAWLEAAKQTPHGQPIPPPSVPDHPPKGP